MSDSNPKEPGRFGEDGAAVIQVTPGQIVGAALFLTVAAAIFFFAGMFANSLTQGSEEEQPISVAQTADAQNPGVDLSPPDPVEPEPDPEPIPAPPEPKEDPTPVEPEPEPTPEPEVVESDPPVIESGAATIEKVEMTPVIETPPDPEPEPEPTPEPEPEPEEVSPPPPAQPEPKPLPEIPPSTTGPFTVQVMSIGIDKRDKAEVFQRDALENKNVQMELVESSDGKMLRAYVGSYANRSDAETARNELARAGFDGCFIKKREE